MRRRWKIVVIDFPWPYDNKKTGGSMKSAACQKYDVMTMDEILAFPFNDVCDRDCMLFVWTTTPLQMLASEVARVLEEKYRFEYKTKIYWRKVKNGPGWGFWLKGVYEECWVFVRGDVKATRLEDENEVYARVGKHSEKPREVYRLIERMGHAAFKKPTFIDIFARKKWKGWTTIGNALDGKDYREALHSLGVQKV